MQDSEQFRRIAAALVTGDPADATQKAVTALEQAQALFATIEPMLDAVNAGRARLISGGWSDDHAEHVMLMIISRALEGR